MLLLSDGMGCGEAAALDSALLTSLIGRLITAGIPCEAALRLVNSALVVKGGRESLATLDAAAVDCYSGRVTFYKAGAAPTVLRRKGKAATLGAAGLPAGILDGVEAGGREASLGAEDLVLMMSDGVPEEGNWIGKMLEEWPGGDLTLLCRKIAGSARLRRKELREDDITVAALRLVKNR